MADLMVKYGPGILRELELERVFGKENVQYFPKHDPAAVLARLKRYQVGYEELISGRAA